MDSPFGSNIFSPLMYSFIYLPNVRTVGTLRKSTLLLAILLIFSPITYTLTIPAALILTTSASSQPDIGQLLLGSGPDIVIHVPNTRSGCCLTIVNCITHEERFFANDKPVSQYACFCTMIFGFTHLPAPLGYKPFPLLAFLAI